jgi:polysaccharide biosynthesis/export protein
LEKELTPLPMKSILMVVMAMFLLSSCGNKLIYFQQNKDSKNSYEHIEVASPPSTQDHIIKEGDVLHIRLSSPDENLINIFSKNVLDESQSISGYQVQNNGTIFIPFVGNVYVKDMSMSEAHSVLNDSLSFYVNQPNMELELAAFRVIVLGEVTNPGPILVPSDQASLVDVIALAGDLDVYGNPEKIKVIRDVDGHKMNRVVSLSDIDVFRNSFYYMKSNDIIYVETLKRQFLRENFSYIAILSTVLNTILIVTLRF